MSQETLPLLSTLGWEVSKTKSKKSDDYGTAGPFFSLEGSDDLFASTCFHVLLPETMNPKSIKPGKPGPEVSQACPYNFSKIMHFVDGTVKKYANSSAAMEAREKVGRYDEWLKSRSGPQPDEPHQSERAMTDVYEYGSAILAALDAVYDDRVPEKNEVIADTGIKKRVVGKVYAAPEYRVIGAKGVITEAEARGFLNDWALVKLDKNKFRKHSNKVYVGRAGSSWLTRQVEGAPELTLEQQRAVDQEVTSQNGFLRMNGKLASIQEDNPKQGKGEKVGASCSWELLVLPFSDQAMNVDSRTPTRRNCFSTGGDSGSAVLDVYGTFIGQLVSGGPASPPNSIYVKENERTWRGQAQAEGSGDPGKPTIFERGKLAQEATPEDPELGTLSADMDVSFVHVASQLMADIERWTEKKPILLKP
ncbi:hypothetical protein PG993_015153 [Apiospora rasikravindrae]|uniref:Uncharacterized protein n=1 Tax=Apiospora rasikravindrae TaxID=990691 RepID=A0ABR1RPS0_9PEZI